ncbi:MAG: ribosomal RNA small subunit methyltransferase A [Deltaproteobacteria bacterium]|nr:ribosomal RNA small subunit methyltransferase A [Deltaproteobacteria bacterium]
MSGDNHGNGSNGNGSNGNGKTGNGQPAKAPSDPLRSAEAFPDARVILGRYGLQAKKSFGQNFLISERAFRAIVDATVRSDEDWIVEIGAGLGTLTARLAERVTAGKVIALEHDADMVKVLRTELAGVDNVDIEQVDALRYDFKMAAKWRGDPISVCGNLPYHIASQLLFKIIDARASVTHAVVMIQKEMADRIMAPPGGKTYGAIGVMLRTYADVTSVAKVGAGSFVPPPKIDSTVIKLVPLAGGMPRVPIADEKHYSIVVHAAFGQRRKTLRNALRAMFEDAAVDAALAQTAIDGQRRGETLDIAEFGALAGAIPASSMVAER